MTQTPLTDAPTLAYWQSLGDRFPGIAPAAFAQLTADLQNIDWNEPTSAIELNNLAVMTLIEAEQSEDVALRAMNLELAGEMLQQGMASNSHPLCAAHLALIYSISGDLEAASRLAFSTLVESLQPAYTSPTRLPLGLVYFPQELRNLAIARPQQVERILQAADGYLQAQLLLVEVLCQSQLVFYNANGLRFLQLAAQLSPDDFAINLKLGISKIINQQWEGIRYLQQARKLAPDCAPVLQALYLLYGNQQPDIANYWLNLDQGFYQQVPQSIAWRWTELPLDSPFTYLPFESDYLLAVEPGFRSMVTSVLLAEGDWFEAEMQFWRSQIQPGMTVIDVGANVGVYTFSAAKRVGATGRVVAIEPVSGCVCCLEETRRVNQLSWVTVCAGAASDRNGTARLALHTANELNEVVVDESQEITTGQAEAIQCFALDSLIEQENITQVDWIKIDAEGHEIQVLQGSDRLLTQFSPGILYENIAGVKESNTAVAELLRSKGYQLFRYQPYLETLLPIEDLEDLQGSLNIIALPGERLS